MIFDTHAHYEDEQFNKDRDMLLVSMEENGVGKIIDVGASIESTKGAVELAHRYDFVYAAVGIHPDSVGELNESHMEWLKLLAADKKVVAIGEIGLDYHYEEPEREIQKVWFERQLELAHEVKLPVCIHSREAAKDTLDIMKLHNADKLGGVIHCFSYSTEMAQTYVDMGFYIGVGGVVTFKNSKKLKEVVKNIPLEHIVLETDCPYMAPVPNRGKRNSSIYLPYVVTAISEIKGISEEKVIKVTEENGLRLYRIAEQCEFMEKRRKYGNTWNTTEYNRDTSKI